MTLEPFTIAPLAIQVHVVSVLSAAALGVWMFVRPKGTAAHRATGRVWMAIMVAAALSSFLIPRPCCPLSGRSVRSMACR